VWILEKKLPNGKLYKDSGDPRKKKLEIFLDPTFQVSASSDDCHVTNETLSISLTANTVRVGYDSQVDSTYDAGLRFTNVGIPRGAKINSAYLTLVAYATQTAEATANIKGEASDNAATFSTYSDFTGRPRTSAVVSWAMPSTSADASYNTPDISSIIQEIVNRAGWNPGNALVIFLEYASGAYRTWYSYDGDPTKAAILTVTFTVLLDDSGLGEDLASVVIEALESGLGEDLASTIAYILADDYSTGEDFATVYQTQALDSGLGEDFASIQIIIEALDSGLGVDSASTVGYIHVDDSAEGLESPLTGQYLVAYDEGVGEEFALAVAYALADDYATGEDSADVRNPLMEAITKLFNFIVRITPLAIMVGSVVGVAKAFKKPKKKK